MREKVSLSLDRGVTKEVDKLIDNVYVKNRSQAFELLLKKSLLNKKVDSAVILIGGPKDKAPFHKVYGKLLLEYQLEKLKSVDIKNIFIAAGNHTTKLFSVVGDGSGSGVKITFLKEKKPLGTAGALKLSEQYLNSTFITICGDIFFDFELEKLLEFHKNKDAIATIALTTVEKKISTDDIKLNGDSIKSFIYASRSKSFLTNAGIYVFEPKIFSYLPEKGSLEKDVFPVLAKENKLVAFNFSGGWKHIAR